MVECNTYTNSKLHCNNNFSFPAILWLHWRVENGCASGRGSDAWMNSQDTSHELRKELHSLPANSCDQFSILIYIAVGQQALLWC